jgi:hypothetical protein
MDGARAGQGAAPVKPHCARKRLGFAARTSASANLPASRSKKPNADNFLSNGPQTQPQLSASWEHQKQRSKESSMTYASKSALLTTGLLAAVTLGLTKPADAKCPAHLMNCEIQAIKELRQVVPVLPKVKLKKEPGPRPNRDLSSRSPVLTRPIATVGSGPLVIPNRNVQLLP